MWDTIKHKRATICASTLAALLKSVLQMYENLPDNGWVKANPKQLSRLNRATRGDSVFVYLHIVKFSRKHGYCWSSLNTIADELEISRKSVQRSIKKLSEVGAILIDSESKITNCYTPVDLSKLDLIPKIIGSNLKDAPRTKSTPPRTKSSPGRNRPDPQDEIDLQ